VSNSLGRAYSQFTQYLGFKTNNDEYKVMGLASYGKPTYDLSKLIKITKNGYEVEPSYFYNYSFTKRKYDVSKLAKAFGQARKDDNQRIDDRHKNIAASIQKRLEDVGLHLVKKAIEKTNNKNLCLAGGVALNCKMNGEILQSGLIEDIYVQPVANDAGTALGAALELYAKLGYKSKFKMDHVYWGNEYSKEQIEEALKKSKLKYTYYDDIEGETAKEISKGNIIGWFQGRMEVGPRALGNRSILANPTIKGMDDKVNIEIKFREKWRPFCPSMLESAKEEYLEGAHETPFMILTFNVKKDKRKEIPSVTHIDGTARPQTVRKETNPKYWKLIKSFESESGTPVLMNTSFNIKGDTIVRTPDDAIRTFLNTGMNVLSIGNYMVKKKK